MSLSRRSAIQIAALGGVGLCGNPGWALTPQQTMIRRNIPSSGEPLPVVGVGTWQTFDVPDTEEALQPLQEVLQVLYEKGGRMIDSSPMYGGSEAVVGQLTAASPGANDFFYATKVWTSGREAGIRQMESSMHKMRRERMDLMQIHNLVDWQTHVRTLKSWKEAGRIRYWGITHYTDASHAELERVIRQEKPDFAQFNYSIRSRHAENSLLETCRKQGTAVIVNQPYESGSLFRLTRGKALPDWASEYDIQSWGQFFLKFILSHPAVTCVIPGTADPKHMRDNVLAGYGKLPDAETRKRMVGFLNSIQ